ncbi:MAG: hypothetical protein KGL39_45020 [Patescibacteria group bacterium]|nr:hypothetical protein [Patescibacteria group bacterium]
MLAKGAWRVHPAESNTDAIKQVKFWDSELGPEDRAYCWPANGVAVSDSFKYPSLTFPIQTTRTVETAPTTSAPIKNQFAKLYSHAAVANDGHAIKIIIGWTLIFLSAMASWVGVWSIVFWDWLRGTRFWVSVGAWVAFAGFLAQGVTILSAYPQ